MKGNLDSGSGCKGIWIWMKGNLDERESEIPESANFGSWQREYTKSAIQEMTNFQSKNIA